MMDLIGNNMGLGVSGCFWGHSWTFVGTSKIGLYFSKHFTFWFMGVKFFVGGKRLSTAKAWMHGRLKLWIRAEWTHRRTYICAAHKGIRRSFKMSTNHFISTYQSSSPLHPLPLPPWPLIPMATWMRWKGKCYCDDILPWGYLIIPWRSKKAKKKGNNDSLYLSAACTIARCHDLWCEPDKVFKIVRLVQEEEASKNGDIDDDDLGREAHEEYLSNM